MREEQQMEKKTEAKQIHLDQVLPGQIEAKSFEIIGQELQEMGIRLKPEEELVIKRAIHASADFDYAQNLVFSPEAVGAGLEAIRKGCHIVTDTRMAWSGINKAASMEKAAALYGAGGRLERTPCIFAVGNAPTALIRLYELVQESKLRPALIIAMPVGFVNVVQSKELILSLKKTPFIVARGRKGGSNIAAAVCNALIYQA